MKLNDVLGRSPSSDWRASRAVTWASISESVSTGTRSRNNVRAYHSVCNNPGTSRFSKVYRLIATSSSSAHCRNHEASPFSRVACL
ncbi:hypothetical protein SCANM124S_02637 [Streptomyces canus]